ncbi:hypothetical protein [Ciceribacter sp. L1K22]|uniref:hypothetical protein n=1 Tax=Ciceribacter sp. L1K22 TaxID=2820275 RepID=UPI001ABDACAC|nr:hypothetical protein [Ciceribacter sp. L1K22]MBO3762319.1 hypothetical protein [Ciceribacter sp. L1K22]
MRKKADQGAGAAVKLPAVPSIRCIDEIHGLIAGAIAGSPDAVIELDAAADPDLCVIQLLEAARLDAERQGRLLRLAQPANENTRRTLDRAGLSAGGGGAFNRFWYHQENNQ